MNQYLQTEQFNLESGLELKGVYLGKHENIGKYNCTKHFIATKEKIYTVIGGVGLNLKLEDVLIGTIVAVKFTGEQKSSKSGNNYKTYSLHQNGHILQNTLHLAASFNVFKNKCSCSQQKPTEDEIPF